MTIAAGLAAFRPVPGRREIRRLGNGAFIIIDAYNANPASVREALKTLQGLRGAATPSRSWVTCWSWANEPRRCTGRSGRSSPKPASTRALSQGNALPVHRGRGAEEGVSRRSGSSFLRIPEEVVADLRSPAEKGGLDPDQGVPKDENGSGGGRDHRGI